MAECGTETDDSLAELLRRHLLITADVMEAARRGDPEKLKSDAGLWYETAGEIAGLMTGALRGRAGPARNS